MGRRRRGAAAAVEDGCKAVAWTVRGGAHILPQNVERDLPGAVDAAPEASLEAPMVITNIVDAKSERVDAILDTRLGTDYGTWNLEMQKSEWLSLLKRDVTFYSDALREAGLT